jgi:hypothetical protein
MSNTPLVPPAAGVPQTADPGAGYGRDGPITDQQVSKLVEVGNGPLVVSLGAGNV